jgi:sec-independent protein translocase protein TatC
MTVDKDEPLIAHLEELRTRLIKCFIVLGTLFIPMFWIAPYGMKLLIKIMLGNNEISLNFFSPLEIFLLEIKMAVVLDIVVCFPYIAKHVWHFIAPGLYTKERQLIENLVIKSALLFITGVLFCLFLILPMVIKFGLSFAEKDIQALFGISNVVTLALWLSVIFGLMFQFPLITYGLIKAQIIGYESVKAKRPYVFTGILIFSALLTPPDVMSQLLLTFPTYLLFEVGLFMAKRKTK